MPPLLAAAPDLAHKHGDGIRTTAPPRPLDQTPRPMAEGRAGEEARIDRRPNQTSCTAAERHKTMTTQNNAAQLPSHVANAIQEAQTAAAILRRANEALEKAIQDHFDADTQYRHADPNTDAERDAWDAYQTTADALCSIARTRTDARMHNDQTKAALETTWTAYQTEKAAAEKAAAEKAAKAARLVDAEQQIALLQDYSAALGISGATKAAEYAAYEVEDETYRQLDRRVAEMLVQLEEEDEDWDGDPAAEHVLDYVRSIHGTPFEDNTDTDAYLGPNATMLDYMAR